MSLLEYNISNVFSIAIVNIVVEAVQQQWLQ